jgi:hypothetical protein
MGCKEHYKENRFVFMRTIFFFIVTIISIQSFSQNIGIGTINPVGRLQINHRSQFSPGILILDSTATAAGTIRFKNITSTSYIELSGYSGGPTFSSHQFLDIKSDSFYIATFQGNGRVGIGTLSPDAKLEVAGDIISTELVGTGIRQLFADGSGRLVTLPLVTGNASVSAKSFTKNSSSTATVFFTDPERGYLAAGATDVIGAPVNLPNGVRIVGIRFLCLDNSATQDLEVSLNRAFSTLSGYTRIALLNTSGSSLDFRSFSATANHVVDNFNNFYTIEIRPSSGGHTWDGFNLAFRGVVISYEY